MSRVPFLIAAAMIGALNVAAAQSFADGEAQPAVPAAVQPTPGTLLLPPKSETPTQREQPTVPSKPVIPYTTAIGGLAVCLGLFFLFVWATKGRGPQGTAILPKEVVEPLGRTMLSNRHHLQLLRIGRKLILLDVTPGGSRTLTEITDSNEVEHLLGLCQQGKANSVTASFREVLSDYESMPAAKGFLGDTRQTDRDLAARTPRRHLVRREAGDA